MAVSLFSLAHCWSLSWRRHVACAHTKFYGESSRQQSIEAIASIGVIGGTQISHLFHLDKHHKKQMEQRSKLVRHNIKKNNHDIPIYTVGPGQSGLGEYHDWMRYDEADVIKRLLFFKLYATFSRAEIIPAPAPFIGAIHLQDKQFYVYVVRGGIQDLLRYLKWRASGERVLIVTESLTQLTPLIPFVDDLKARVTTDESLCFGHENIFYRCMIRIGSRKNRSYPLPYRL